MSCYHPKKGFIIGRTENDKKLLKIVDYGVDHVELDANGVWNASTVPDSSDRAVGLAREWLLIPCGKCVGCKLDYSRQWADRCMLEMQQHEHTWFVTLTYDDSHLPKSWYSASEDGDALMAATLSKRDLQLFFKRLRKHTGQDIRYFCAGEYGDSTHRPHYHCIIFGLDLPAEDLTLYKVEHGYHYYNSETINRAWTFPCRDELGRDYGEKCLAGYCVVTECTWETAAYTARYCLKKAFSDQGEFYENFNLQPEFTQMSRRPGIAWQYYQDNKDSLYEYDYVSISTPKGGRKIRPSRYYDKLFDIDFPDRMVIIKDERKEKAEIAQNNIQQVTGRTFVENLAIEEEAKLNKIKSLIRREQI